MADIFISYARADRERAERLAQALGTAGWSVWWDREIPPGKSFDEVIEEALSNARCVIVLWSAVSVRSEWVKTEAADAAQRGILVPILVDGARIPLEFRRIQSAAFDRWDDPAANRDWPQLNDAVKALVGARPVSPPVAPSASTSASPPPTQRTINRPRAVTAISGALAAVAVTAGAVYFGASLLFTASGAASSASTTPAASTSSIAARSPQAPSIPSPVVAATPVRPPDTTPADRPRDRAISRLAPLATTLPTRMPDTRPATTAGTVGAPAAPTSRDSAAGLAGTRPVPTAGVHEEGLPVAPPVTRVADRAPAIDRPGAEAAFDVTLVYGVFRDQAGRLSISPDGVRFRERDSGHGSFEVSCGEIRKISTSTMIADREQRLLELTLPSQAYRLRAADTSTRDSIRGALGRNCGPR